MKKSAVQSTEAWMARNNATISCLVGGVGAALADGWGLKFGAGSGVALLLVLSGLIGLWGLWDLYTGRSS
jgi:hypothetical protein